jgi:hypothetical protein
MEHTMDMMLDLAKARQEDLLREAHLRRMLRSDERHEGGATTRRLRRILAPLLSILA